VSRVPCPKCATPLDDDQSVCPFCRRARSPDELTAARGETTGGAHFPVETVVWTLLVLLAAGAAVRWRAQLASGLSSAALALSIGASLVGGGGRPTAPAPKATAPAADAAAPSVACRAPGTGRNPVAPDHSLMTAYGVVTDLATGCAVPGALITMLSAGDTTGRTTRTGDDGFYEIQFEGSLKDTAITASQSGYRAGQVEDTDPPMRERTAAARRDYSVGVTARDLEPVPVLFPPSADSLRVDLVLLPAR
jgi:hypothetical protein